MNQVTAEQQFRDALNSDGLTVAVFKADWCVDCRFMDPFMPEVEKQYQDRMTFMEVDRDALPDLCSELNILGIPSFIAFQNGRELIRFVSKLRKTREEIEQFLERAIQVSQAMKSS